MVLLWAALLSALAPRLSFLRRCGRLYQGEVGLQGAVWSCVLNSTAMLAATASADFSAKLWDAITGDELHTLQHSHIVRACQFAEQSPKLITGGAALAFTIIHDWPQLILGLMESDGGGLATPDV